MRLYLYPLSKFVQPLSHSQKLLFYGRIAGLTIGHKKNLAGRKDRKVTKNDTVCNKRLLEHFAFIYLFIERLSLLLAKESSPYRYVEVISVLGEE